MTTRITFGLICLSCLLGIIFSNCQSDAAKSKSSEKYFINYYVRFLESDQLTQATAQIKKGVDESSAVIEKIAQGVFFQGAAMKYYKTLKAPEYRTQKKGSFLEEYAFKFKPGDNPQHQSAIRLNPIDLPNITGPISKSGSTQLQWQGKALQENESLVLLFNDSKNKAAFIEIEGPTEASSIQIEGKNLNKLIIGAGGLSIVRKKLDTSIDGPLNTMVDTEFYSKKIPINIIE